MTPRTWPATKEATSHKLRSNSGVCGLRAQRLGVDALLASRATVDEGGVRVLTGRGSLCYHIPVLTHMLRLRRAAWRSSRCRGAHWIAGIIVCPGVGVLLQACSSMVCHAYCMRQLVC